MTTEQKQDYQYDNKILEKFAKLIAFDYKNDFEKFCLDKKALNKNKEVIKYRNPQDYYTTQVNNTEFFVVDDFFRPDIPYSFWNRLNKQSARIRTAIIEDYYAQIVSQGLPDPRIEAMQRVSEKLAHLKKK